MTRCFVSLTAAAAMLAGTSPASAHGQQTPSPGAATVAAPNPSPVSKRPFGRVFTQQPPGALPLLRLRIPLPDPLPSKTCGMLVLPPDPTIDPKFERSPADTRTRFSIRTIPWICR